MARLLAMVLLVLLTGLAGCGDPSDESDASVSAHFTDVTAASGIDMVPVCGEDPPTRLMEVKGCGVALIDYDGDGDADLFVPNGATLADPEHGPGARLFRNEGDLRFTDVTAETGLAFHRWGYGAAVGDADGDGRDDLYVSCFGNNALLMNRGGGRFEDVALAAGVAGDVWSAHASFGDIDGDGDLDLYVANYAVLPVTGPAPQATFLGVKVFAGPMGLPTVPDVLYRNEGDGSFTDISEESGIHSRPAAWALGAVILDMDGDHLADIYVGNDSSASFLFRNLGGGRFEEVGVNSGVAFNEDGAGQATMGIALADVTGNGSPDLFTTNFMHDSNTLHANLGGLLFEDRTRSYGLHSVSQPFLSWATGFFDLDHDADEDLVVFSGHIYPEETCAEQGWKYRQLPLLFERVEKRFEVATAARAGAWLGEPRCDRSAAFGDLDGDGDIDMIVVERNGPLRLLRNDRDDSSWLQVELRDGRPGHDPRGFGSQIVLRSGSATQTRWIASGVGFMATSEPIAHFGLGAAGAPSRSAMVVEVTWSDGHLQRVEGVAPARRILVERD